MPDIVYSDHPARFAEHGKGTYILVLKLVAPTTMTIGKLGSFHFDAGWYTYVGSAYGTGGLQGRLKHHLSPMKKPHWHIDYLRQKAGIEEIWYASCATAHEHEWATIICTLPDATITVSRFGASDCQCQTHLSYFAQKPAYDVFSDLAGTPIQKWISAT